MAKSKPFVVQKVEVSTCTKSFARRGKNLNLNQVGFVKRSHFAKVPEFFSGADEHGLSIVLLYEAKSIASQTHHFHGLPNIQTFVEPPGECLQSPRSGLHPPQSFGPLGCVRSSGFVRQKKATKMNRKLVLYRLLKKKTYYKTTVCFSPMAFKWKNMEE